MTRLRQRMLDDLRRRNYSPDTIRGYIRAVQQFAEYFGRSPEQLGAAELRRYQLYLLHERKLALGTVENCISALRFLYKKTLKRRDLAFDDLPFPKQPRTLPTVLSQDEVTRLIEAAPNRMHRMLLMLLYATGMRRTEASLLKVSDIDSQRMVIHIRRGKGLRDRDVPLTPKLLEALREYWRSKKPRVYLFPSKMSDPGVEQPISDKTVWNICRAVATRAGIQKKLGPHTFRHCFATQHVERLAAYWAEALGGPSTYSDSYGDETSVVKMHSGNGEHAEMDRRAIACFDQALADVGLADGGALRQVLHDYFAWATTTTMSRYHQSADDVPNGLSIPHWSWDGLQV